MQKINKKIIHRMVTKIEEIDPELYAEYSQIPSKQGVCFREADGKCSYLYSSPSGKVFALELSAVDGTVSNEIYLIESPPEE